MDDATQKLVDEANLYVERYGLTATSDLVDRLRAALEAAQRESFGLREKLEISMAVGAKDAAERDVLEAAQRLPVSPEVREALAVAESALAFWNNGSGHHDAAWVSRMAYNMGDALQRAATALRLLARFSIPQRPTVSPKVREELAQTLMTALGCRMEDDTCECEYPCSHKPFAVCLTHDWEDAVGRGEPCPHAARMTDALLARFSVPSQPVYDEEKVAEWFATFAVQTNPYGLSIPIDQAHEAAAALVAALRDGELTVEETNE